MFDQALFERLFARVYVVPETGCHVWQGQTDGKETPYGRTTYKGQTIGAHIAMWKACNGRIRKGFQIDHKCTNRLCIRIEHLQEVTNLKNQRLRVKRAKHKGDVFRCLAVK
jgi:hypothetical protein